jgi:hypothetical protein
MAMKRSAAARRVERSGALPNVERSDAARNRQRVLAAADRLFASRGAANAAMVDLLERHAHLVLGAETGRSRFQTGAYGFWRAHVRALLADARAPAPDALADALLAPLAPEVYIFQRTDRALSPEQITAALRQIAQVIA